MAKTVYVITLTAPGKSAVGNQVPAPLAEPYASLDEAWFELFKYMGEHAKPRLKSQKADLWDFFVDLAHLGAADWGIHRYTIQPVQIPADSEESDDRAEPDGDG